MSLTSQSEHVKLSSDSLLVPFNPLDVLNQISKAGLFT